MTVIDLKEKIAEKKGMLTPKALIEDLLEQINRGEIETVVYVAKAFDKEVKCGHSEKEQSSIIGLLELGKVSVINDMYELK